MSLSLAQDIKPIALIELSPRLRDYILKSSGDVLRKISGLLHPYKVQFELSHDGLRPHGDPIAIDLAGRILEALDRTDLSLPDAMLMQTAHTVIDKALQQDLAFRLPGLLRPLRPLSLSQTMFVDAVLHDPHDLILGIGPSGVGKTMGAIAAGLNLLAEGHVNCMILTKPHVLLEGEVMTPAMRAETAKDLQLTVFTDALHDLIGEERMRHQMEIGEIAVMPLGMLRGRTFNNAFILIDEAQNMNAKKMRMAVTRAGRDSRLVITGDPDHIDLHDEGASGLAHLLNLVRDRDVAHVHQFERNTIVRDTLASRLDALYATQTLD